METRSVRRQPRLSVNQLAEYVQASAQKRRKILHDAKYPPTIPSVYYDEPTRILKKFYAGGFDTDYLEEAIGRVDEKEADSDPAKIKKAACLKVLQAVLEEDRSSPLIPYDDIQIHNGRGKYIVIEGVEISVCPDLIISKLRAEQVKVGAVKFILSKNEPKLNSKGEHIVSEMLFKYVETYIVTGTEVAHKRFCFSFDPFRGVVGESPATSVRLLREIEENCREIVARWGTI